MKNAELLLERYPDHPETNAMKALFLSGLGRQDEAVVYIKKILFKNLSNFTCWHVQGLLLRKEKDYDQARRAYL